MTKHFERELEKLKKKILALGAMVEEQFYLAIKAIESGDADLAAKIIKADHGIDEMEVDVEEECLKVLALHQPVAIDLRFITAVIKINNDLERIGDQAVNIAERIQSIAKRSSPSFHIPQVAVPPEGINLREVIAHFERRLIESTLETTGGVQKDAARLLGLKPTTLNEMIKRHSILLPRDRERRNSAREEASAAKTTPA